MHRWTRKNCNSRSVSVQRTPGTAPGSGVAPRASTFTCSNPGSGARSAAKSGSLHSARRALSRCAFGLRPQMPRAPPGDVWITHACVKLRSIVFPGVFKYLGSYVCEDFDVDELLAGAAHAFGRFKKTIIKNGALSSKPKRVRLRCSCSPSCSTSRSAGLCARICGTRSASSLISASAR